MIATCPAKFTGAATEDWRVLTAKVGRLSALSDRDLFLLEVLVEARLSIGQMAEGAGRASCPEVAVALALSASAWSALGRKAAMQLLVLPAETPIVRIAPGDSDPVLDRLFDPAAPLRLYSGPAPAFTPEDLP